MATITIIISGCVFNGETKTSSISTGYIPIRVIPSATHLAASVPKSKLTTVTRQLAFEGIKAMDAGKYKKASALFNLALKSDITNSGLHFLNALAYQMRAMEGEGKLYSLAKQGYKMAIKFDGSNNVARYYLGLLLLNHHQFVPAEHYLMEASLYTQKDSDLLYNLSVAAYYAKDPQTANVALTGVRQLEGKSLSKRTLRASAIVAAALGEHKAAQRFLKKLKTLDTQGNTANFVSQRINAWNESQEKYFIKTAAADNSVTAHDTLDSDPFGVAQYTKSHSLKTDNDSSDSGGSNATTGFADSKESFFEKKMVDLEVVILATEQDNTNTFGVNLLDGLRIQFGDSLGTPALRRTFSTSNNVKTNTITKLIQIPGITYSLNIANSNDRLNDVLARPSLVAMGGQTSTFFSGTDIIGAAVSTGQGGSVQVHKEAGVKLTITPEFLPDDLIKLQIEAQRTFLTNPNSDVLFDFRLDTSKILVNANVVMKFGETLILSGLSERDVQTNTSGVPILRDIPLVQYLFSKKSDSDFHKSVLILITPRRPNYTNRSEKDIQKERAKMSEFELMQSEFENKYKMWFKPIPGEAVAEAMLQRSPVFREFRTGDLKMENWLTRPSHGERLRSELKFLYF